jgi:predicted thioesterase
MNIPLGARREERILVTSENAISFLGLEGARVLSTPDMIGYMEMTARNLIKEHVAEGEDSVGTVVNVKHLAATPIGMSVRLTAEVTAVENRRVICTVEAWDDVEKVGAGLHERFVVDVARFAERVQAKASART